MIWLTILIGVCTALIGFWLGIRYCGSKLLPTIMARMTPEELKELARKAADERESS